MITHGHCLLARMIVSDDDQVIACYKRPVQWPVGVSGCRFQTELTAISYLISASQGASILREVGKLQGVMGKNTRTTKHWDDVEYPTTNE